MTEFESCPRKWFTEYVLAEFIDPTNDGASYLMNVKAGSPPHPWETRKSFRERTKGTREMEVRPNIVGVDSEGHVLITAKVKPEGITILSNEAANGATEAPWTVIGSSSAAYGAPCPIIRFRRDDEPWFRRTLGG